MFASREGGGAEVARPPLASDPLFLASLASLLLTALESRNLSLGRRCRTYNLGKEGEKVGKEGGGREKAGNEKEGDQSWRVQTITDK